MHFCLTLLGQAQYPELAPQKGLYLNKRYQELKAKERKSLLSQEGSRIFAKRKVDVEPVFGQIKACLGYKRCQLRGNARSPLIWDWCSWPTIS
nr:transposase [Streptococcus gallolyticus]